MVVAVYCHNDKEDRENKDIVRIKYIVGIMVNNAELEFLAKFEVFWAILYIIEPKRRTFRLGNAMENKLNSIIYKSLIFMMPS